MATLREWLTEDGFDWENGFIIYQPETDDSYSAGWGDSRDVIIISKYLKNIPFAPNAVKIVADHERLDEDFSSGYGAPECPRFIAEDNEKIYFPVQYDGSTWTSYIYRDLAEYTRKDKDGYMNNTPYPGG